MWTLKFMKSNFFFSENGPRKELPLFISKFHFLWLLKSVCMQWSWVCHVWRHVHWCVCMCIWYLEDKLKCCSLGTIHLVLRRASHWPGVSHVGWYGFPERPRDLPASVLPILAIQIRVAIPSSTLTQVLRVKPWASHLQCKALPTESSPTSLLF